MSSIPANAVIDSASITLNVTDASTAAVYTMYDVTKPWVDGTQNGVQDTAGANWTNYNQTGPFPWGTAGASKIDTGSIDRNTVNLWSTTAGSFTPTGSRTVSLTAGGLTVLSRWLAGGVNNGVIIQLYSGTSSDTLAFDSKEGTTPPALNVTYCLPTSTTTYTLTANNDGNGSVTLAPTGGTYTSGTTVTLTPVPNTVTSSMAGLAPTLVTSSTPAVSTRSSWTRTRLSRRTS